MSSVVRKAPGFADIDWSTPWFAPFAVRGRRWQQAALTSEAALLDAMNADAQLSRHTVLDGRHLAFVAQSELPTHTAYEAHIAATGCVPTRHNLHDFFNALSWFQFPRMKATQTARGSAAVGSMGRGPTRGGTRDALTLFDENAVLFASADPALSAALRAFDWQSLFVVNRDAWGQRCEAHCFGHALLEKLTTPFKACTAHAWIVDVPPAYFAWPDERRSAWLDDSVSRQLSGNEPLSSRAFAPLPVLGIPAWWPENEAASFYDDVSVFRHGRRARSGDARIAPSKASQAVAAFPVSAGEGEESPDSTGQGDG